MGLTPDPNSEISDKERVCRMLFEAQGCKVLKFWLDDEGFGTCLVKDHRGIKVTFTQNPKLGNKVFKTNEDGSRTIINDNVRKAT